MCLECPGREKDLLGLLRHISLQDFGLRALGVLSQPFPRVFSSSSPRDLPGKGKFGSDSVGEMDGSLKKNPAYLLPVLQAG